MKPTIGRIVWYQSHGSPNGQHKSEPRAAIVTGLSGAEVGLEYQIDLCVLSPTGLFFNQGVPYDEDGRPGSWRWPPRV
jgi:hypothetical protein